jgi:endonuclease YncB( thermonuclease family)
MFKIERIVAAAAIRVLFAECLSLAAQLKCTRVTDVDTITIVTDGQKHTIRLVGIGAPEKSRDKHKPGQPFSQTATKHLASLALNKYVDIVPYVTDRYDRMLGIVDVNGKNVNLEMVQAGLAEVYRGKPAPVFDYKPYQKEEETARRAERGMWSPGDQYTSLNPWRKKHR